MVKRTRHVITTQYIEFLKFLKQNIPSWFLNSHGPWKIHWFTIEEYLRWYHSGTHCHFQSQTVRSPTGISQIYLPIWVGEITLFNPHSGPSIPLLAPLQRPVFHPWGKPAVNLVTSRHQSNFRSTPQPQASLHPRHPSSNCGRRYPRLSSLKSWIYLFILGG